MNIANLSFSALPPISVPFRYFISAAIFLILGSLLVLVSGEAVWHSRWHPNMLAITHLFTLGFVSMVMMGAIYQFLPVIGGIGLPNVRIVAAISHSLHTLGTLALSWNFIFPSAIASIITILALGVGFAFYIFAVVNVLHKKLSQGPTIIGMRFAILALVFVVMLGLLLLATNTFISSISFSFIANKNYTDIHALLGGFGWAGVLILAVSLQIIPMFHVTPNFPNLLAKYMPVALITLLFLLFTFKPSSLGGQAIITLILGVYGLFNLAFLLLFKKKKRKITDISVYFWQLAGVSFIALICMCFLPDILFQQMFNGNKALLLSAVFVYFYLVSIIEAMLLKIIPFLAYTHLQNMCLSNFSAMAYLPHMHELLLKKHGRWLFNFHLISCCFLVATVAFNNLYWLFAIAMFVEFSTLLFLILRSLYLYKLSRDKINLVV